MNKRINLIILAITLAFLTSCSTVIPSVIFNGTTQHVYTNTPGGQLTSAKVEKSGQSCSFTFFPAYLFFYGVGGGIEEAKKEGGISKVAVVDRKSASLFGVIFNRECVMVWGE